MGSEISLTTPLGTGSAIGASTAKPKDAADAARQFEALLIQEMLKSAKSGASGGALGGEDEANSALSDMAEQQFSQLLASNGGIGLAKLVMDGMAQRDAGKGQSPDADRQHSAGGAKAAGRA